MFLQDPFDDVHHVDQSVNRQVEVRKTRQWRHTAGTLGSVGSFEATVLLFDRSETFRGSAGSARISPTFVGHECSIGQTPRGNDLIVNTKMRNRAFTQLFVAVVDLTSELVSALTTER